MPVKDEQSDSEWYTTWAIHTDEELSGRTNYFLVAETLFIAGSLQVLDTHPVLAAALGAIGFATTVLWLWGNAYFHQPVRGPAVDMLQQADSRFDELRQFRRNFRFLGLALPEGWGLAAVLGYGLPICW
jgi:hypothetical protein